MKYGQIAGNKSINEAIYKCFECISEEDARKFVKKFARQPHDESQVMDTLRELLLGAYLASVGFNVRYDYPIDSRTPDWCAFDVSSNLSGIFELINFHTKHDIEKQIEQAFQSKDFWMDWMPSNENRLYQSIWKKAQTYTQLLEKYRVPYVISVFGDFFAAVDFDELHQCLSGSELGLFKLYPKVSGVVFFEERGGKYLFKYFPNPYAELGITIADGLF